MERYVVRTHVGDYETVAKSEAKAKNNVRYRLFGPFGGREYVVEWTVLRVG